MESKKFNEQGALQEKTNYNLCKAGNRDLRAIKRIKYERIVGRDLTLITGRKKNGKFQYTIFPRSVISNSCRHRYTHCTDSSSEKYSPVFMLSVLTLDFSFIEEIKTSVRDTKLFCHKCLEVFKFGGVLSQQRISLFILSTYTRYISRQIHFVRYLYTERNLKMSPLSNGYISPLYIG